MFLLAKILISELSSIKGIFLQLDVHDGTGLLQADVDHKRMSKVRGGGQTVHRTNEPINE